MIDLGIRTGPWGDDLGRRPGGLTLDEVRRHPDGLRLGELEGGRLSEVLTTPSHRIELMHPLLTADIPRLLSRIDRASDGLVLTSRRHLRSNNSWLHNVAGLMRGRDRCTLLINPTDAAHLGVSDGRPVDVSTTEGSIRVPAEVTDEMMPGVVSLPHGWGHGVDGTQMSVANAHPGVNTNVLNPAALIDVPSNTQVVNGVQCQVVPVPAAG